MTERDDTTGLDHTWWRKYENLSGRWTTPDPYNGSMAIADPQSFNRYSYTESDPVNFIDPTGLDSNPGFIPPSENGWNRMFGVNPLAIIISMVTFSDEYRDIVETTTIILGGGPQQSRRPRFLSPVPKPPQPQRSASPGANTESCETYSRAGRPDLAAICRLFGNGPWTNRFRQCLLNHFYVPRNGRGYYLDNPGKFAPFPIYLGPVVGPGVHADCLDQ